MTDLEKVATVRPDVPLPSSRDLGESRRRLDEAIGAELSAVATRPTIKKRPTPPALVRLGRTRPLTRVALAGVLAAAVVGLALVIAAPSPASHDQPAVIQLAAAQFLHKVADRALSQTGGAPSPNQYVYSEAENPDGTISQTWLSVNGANPGLTQWMKGSTSGGRNVLPPCTSAQVKAQSCTEAGYFPDMPTDSNDLLGFLNKIGVIDTVGQSADNIPGWEDNVIAKAVSYLMETRYVLPAQQAALYSLMAQTPGFEIIPAMKDAVGRSGVGIQWTFEGDTGAVIFDAATYAYLGTRTWPGPLKLDGPYYGAALVKTAIVDSAGAMP